jgi:hypothetical protein
MRTTLTLEPEVAGRIRREVRRTGKALKVVVNEALKRGLGMQGRAPRAPAFRVAPRAFGIKPGVDLDRLNQVVDELDVEAASAKVRP